MKPAFVILLGLAGLLSGTNVSAQKIVSCDTVYEHTDSAAEYPGGPAGLLEFVKEELIPLIPVTKDSLPPDKLSIILIIDQTGKVVKATFNRPVPNQEDMEKKLLTMQAWKPATVNGKTVCSDFLLPVRICYE